MTQEYGILVLALYPNISGLCYAAFEGRLRVIDWGIKTARTAKHATIIEHAHWLLDVFKPTVIILPARKGNTRGSGRLHKVANDIERLGKHYGAAVHWYSRAQIQDCFLHYGARSKDTIARVIAGQLPEFEQHLPPIRKIWMSEDYRMGLFDAVALAMTFYRDHLPEEPGRTIMY